MSGAQRLKRRLALLFWRLANPFARVLAGIAPFWVVVETIGRKTGKVRQTPLARGVDHDGGHWLIAVHGRHSSFVRNIEAHPEVRFRLRGRWHRARASVHPMDPAITAKMSNYAQSGPKTLGIDPALVRIDLLD